MSGLVFSLKTWYNKNVNHICVFCRRPAELPDHNRHKVSEKRGIDMKGTIIAAMIAAAAAASAATVFALKKAHDKRLDKACNCDDLPEGGCCCTDEDEDDDICLCDTPEETADAEETAEDGEETTEYAAAASGCCADGVCTFGSDDDAADQPAQLHMPEADEDSDTDETEKED